MKGPDIGKLKDYLSSRAEVIAAYLFGSYASGRLRPGSDIDIAVLFDMSVDSGKYGFMRLKIMNELIGRLSFHAIDVAILNRASPLLSHEVLKRGVLLFSKDEKQRLGYMVKATGRYLDTIHLRRVQDTVLHEKIRSGDFGHFKGSHKYSIAKVRKDSGAPSLSREPS